MRIYYWQRYQGILQKVCSNWIMPFILIYKLYLGPSGHTFQFYFHPFVPLRGYFSLYLLYVCFATEPFSDFGTKLSIYRSLIFFLNFFFTEIQSFKSLCV